MGNNARYATFLRELAVNGPNERDEQWASICTLFHRRFETELSALIPSNLYYKWEHFSGDTHHPVPSPHPECDAEDYFVSCSDMWANDEYGTMRRSWCLHLAEYFEGWDD